MSQKNRDYTGKDIYVGIDVHKKTYAVSVVVDKVVVKRDTMKADPYRLISYLQKFFPGGRIKSAYEAGFSGFGLHRALVERGIENIVVHAASIEISARDKVKTDKRDSQKIATQLEASRLAGIRVPTAEREDMRELTRHRQELVKERTRTANKLKAKANYYSLIGPDDSQRVCSAFIAKIANMDLPPNLRYVLNQLCHRWLDYTRQIKEVNELLKTQAAQDKHLERIYRSVPGIGPIAARNLANELDDMSQFSSERALFSYTGFTPREYSSGEHRRQGHISKQGKSSLRCLLVQSAWTAIRKDAELKKIYERIAARSGGKRAIVAVARRLIGRIRSCFIKRELYRIVPLEGPKEQVA